MTKQPIVSDAQELWDREYGTLQVIPSSIREAPSKALLLLQPLLDLQAGPKVLDLGCGNGRNSIFLAKLGCEVHAVDFSKVAVQKSRKSAEEENVSERICFYQQSFFSPLPFQSHSFDLVLDIYVLCHFLNESMRNEYVNLMSRMIRPDGRVVSVVFSTDDEYYETMPTVRPSTVEDPVNGIVKRLFTEDEAKSNYDPLRLEYFLKFEFDDVVLGKIYRRRVYASLLRS